ncbi:hypothetical protein D3C77_601950 [compost metagenome]
MAGTEAGEHQHAKQVDQWHDGGVGHRRQGDAGAAIDTRCKGGADVVVEADAALEHRSEVGTVMVHCALVQHQQHGPGQGREHQHADHAQHRHAIEVGGGQAMEEQRRQQYVIAQALGAGPEVIGEEAAQAQKSAQGNQQDDRQQGSQQQVEHGQRSVVGYGHRLLVRNDL